MKIALIALALLGVAYASPLNYDVRDETDIEDFESFVELKPETFPNFEVDAPRPPNRPATSRPKQIHHNTVNAQGPFSGSLVNMVLNRNGVQETGQKNRILYNINGVRRTVIDGEVAEEDSE